MKRAVAANLSFLQVLRSGFRFGLLGAGLGARGLQGGHGLERSENNRHRQKLSDDCIPFDFHTISCVSNGYIQVLRYVADKTRCTRGFYANIT